MDQHSLYPYASQGNSFCNFEVPMKFLHRAVILPAEANIVQ